MGCGASAKKAYTLPAESTGGGDGKPVAASATPAALSPVSGQPVKEKEAVTTVPADIISIDEAQQKRVATGEAQTGGLFGGSSIKLCPVYSEALRAKVGRYCERVGGIEKMFGMADLDKSRTIDVNEFAKLLMNIPAETAFTRANEELGFDYGSNWKARNISERGSEKIVVKGVRGKEQVLGTETKVPKEKMNITKREATALFWFLDEDESDFIEPDEFEAWLRTGGLIRVKNREVRESYRTPKGPPQ